MYKPEIIAEIYFRKTEEGGRETPVECERLGCLFQIGDDTHDCFLIFNSREVINPGQLVTVPVQFLYPELVLPKLSVGKGFILRDYRIIATGIVKQIL